MKQITSLIVSLDGVLFDLQGHLEESLKDRLKAQGLNLDPTFLTLWMDGGYQSQQRAMIHFPHYRKALVDMDQMIENAINKACINPSALTLTQELTHKGLSLNILSSFSHDRMKVLLDKLPPLDICQTIFGNQVVEGKPEGFIYTSLLHKIKVKGHQVLAIETSTNGILASYLAGVHNIYWEKYHLRTQQIQKYSRYQVTDLDQVHHYLEIK